MRDILNLHNPFAKVIVPVAVIALVWLLCRYRSHISMQKELRVVRPPLMQCFAWLTISLLWQFGTDYIMNWRGPWDFAPWLAQSWYISVCRVLAVGILGPVAEELVFRGYLLYRLTKLRWFNKWRAVIVLAGAWAYLHIDYSLPIIFVIFVFGILMGAALIKTRSIVVPILMHICWNLYAVW